jgi:hypothetical protein
LVKALKNDSLLVICVGYKPARMAFPKADTIFLEPVVIALDEVKVNAVKRNEFSIGYYKSKKSFDMLSGKGVYDKNPLSIKYQNMKLQNDIIRLVFLGFPLLLRLPGENKVPRLRDQNNKNLIFCCLTLVPRPRDVCFRTV